MILHDVRRRSVSARVFCGILLCVFLLPNEARACTRMPFSSTVGAGSVYFLAAALPDTVFAGDGGMDYVTNPGHSGHAAQRVVYGQVFRVDRIGGPAAASLPEGTERVVLVPWDYDAACRPVPWSLSARWAPTEDVAFYGATLRAPEHWAAGIPTFDVRAPELEGYPHFRRPPITMRRTSPDSMMTAEQVFELHEVLPRSDELRAHDFAALDELRAWVAAHPDQATLYPASFLLAGAHGAAETSLRRRTDHPLLGTWRLVFRIDEGEPRTFYIRTRAHPTGEWDPAHTPRSREDLPTLPTLQPTVPPGFAFYASAATKLDDLPRDVRSRDAEGHFFAAIQPDVETPDSTVWIGDIEVWLLARTYPEDAQLDTLQKQWWEDFVARHPTGHATPARFIRRAGGRIRVEADIRLSSGRVIRIDGAQLSRETIPR